VIAYLFLLFITVPLVEFYLLYQLVQVTSLLDTLVLVIVTAIVGSALLRRQFRTVFNQASQRAAQGELPTDALGDAVFLVISGAFLLTPGILTDIVGFALLVPPVRKILRLWLWEKIRSRVTVSSNFTVSTPNESGDQIIDSYVVEQDGSKQSQGSSRPS